MDITGARVEVSDLVKIYRRGESTQRAADGVTVTAKPGTAVALTGPSGSGKSTLLHLIGAIDRPDAGRIVVDGTEVHQLRRAELARYRGSIGFVFQRYNLLPALTAMDNVLAPVLPYRTTFDKRARAAELLDSVGLSGRYHSQPSRMSGGQQQRVAIARSLIGGPRLLLADEPTGNLDSVTESEILDLLFSIRAQRGMTILIATHDLDVAARCDRVIHIQDGRIVGDDQLPDRAHRESDRALARVFHVIFVDTGRRCTEVPVL